METALHPGILLLIGMIVVLILLALFWPKVGLLSLRSRAQLNSQRVLLEDALKFLFDCEYKNVSCGLNSVAGNLNISTDRATKLVNRLRDMNLIVLEGQKLKLTDTGRSYALRVIRVHRIWERYLADETSLKETEWHGEADIREHRISVEDADRLAASLGNPVFDPHGDPIPSSGGDIPEHRGQPLTSLTEGQLARIVHIEDEPQSIYEQLVALGLYPGMQIYLLDIKDGIFTFAAEGEERVLTSLFASNITVEPISNQAPVSSGNKLLSSLELGQKATILGISPNCRGQQRRRLMDLGIVPGTEISAEMRSASGDPVGYRILGATIALRKDQAELVFIEKIKEKENERPT